MRRSIFVLYFVAGVALSVACGGGGSSARTPTPGSSACGGAIAAASCGSASTPSQTAASGSTASAPESFGGIPQDGQTLGSASAPVTIDLYENFLCPHCRDFAVEMLPHVVADYVTPGRAKIRFHDVALGPPAAQLAHEAGECAADQGKFWPAYDAIYAHFSDDEAAYTKANVESWLTGAGIDQTALDGCLSSGKHASDVQASTNAFKQLADTNPAYANALATVEAAQGPAIPLIAVGSSYITAPESYDAVRAAIDATVPTPVRGQ